MEISRPFNGINTRFNRKKVYLRHNIFVESFVEKHYNEQILKLKKKKI